MAFRSLSIACFPQITKPGSSLVTRFFKIFATANGSISLCICGATETILIHKNIVKNFSNPILQKLEINGCKIYGDKILKKYYKGKLYPATEKDWRTEYLNPTV